MRCFILHRKFLRKRLKRIRAILCIILALVFILALTIKIDSRLRGIITTYAQNRAKIIANSVINKAVTDYLSENNISHNSLADIVYDNEGVVRSVEFNTVTISKLQASISSMVQQRISKLENIVVNIPLGTLTGSTILNNRGPEIEVEFKLSSAIFSKVASSFKSKGINQTLHKMSIEVTADMYFVMPLYRTKGEFKSEYTLTETIIVGTVPDAFTNVIEYPNENAADYLFDYAAGLN